MNHCDPGRTRTLYPAPTGTLPLVGRDGEGVQPITRLLKWGGDLGEGDIYELYIGNKNYSSWSLRPWVLMKELDMPFH